jgi:hypothetical protein
MGRNYKSFNRRARQEFIEIKKESLEIAHVLFIDIVGYSKLSISDQQAAVEELTRIVRASEEFQRAEAASRLNRIPTGDGMALAFTPVGSACAMRGGDQLSLKEHPRLQLRMESTGQLAIVDVNKGPISRVLESTWQNG